MELSNLSIPDLEEPADDSYMSQGEICTPETDLYTQTYLEPEVEVESIPPDIHPFESEVEFEAELNKAPESSGDDGNFLPETVNLRKALGDWVMKHNVGHNAVCDLLSLLREVGHSELPKDRRTLMGTIQKVNAIENCGGRYVYLGVENGIRTTFDEHGFREIVDLYINVDGLPIFSSSGNHIWPILAMFNKYDPFLIALYHGYSKPDSVDDFLNDFIKEMSHLRANLPFYEGTSYQVGIKAFICDAPARCFLKGIINHTGYNACERCCTVGKWCRHRIILGSTVKEARTHEKFSQNFYSDENEGGDYHQQGDCPILSFDDIDVVRDVVLDSMHLVFLGVVKRTLLFMKTVKGSDIRLSSGLVNELSLRLVNINGCLPSDFVRQPRSLKFLPYWKATEYRSFLLYSGPVVLKGILSNKKYSHFMHLSVAIYLLSEESDERRNSHLTYCRRLLEVYVKNSDKYLGEIFNVYNVHNLLHIVDDVERFNAPLQDISAFPFENYLQKLKKYVKGTRYPLEEIIKRQGESIGRTNNVKTSKACKVACTPKDGCFRTKDGVVILKNSLDHDMFKCLFYPSSQLLDFYSNPLSSSIIGTYLIRCTTNTVSRVVYRGELLRKCVCLPYGNGYVVMSLLHGMF